MREPPLIKGGQGRTGRDVEDAADNIASALLVTALALASYGTWLVCHGQVAPGVAFACVVPTAIGLARILEWIG